MTLVRDMRGIASGCHASVPKRALDQISCRTFSVSTSRMTMRHLLLRNYHPFSLLDEKSHLPGNRELERPLRMFLTQ